LGEWTKKIKSLSRHDLEKRIYLGKLQTNRLFEKLTKMRFSVNKKSDWLMKK